MLAPVYALRRLVTLQLRSGLSAHRPRYAPPSLQLQIRGATTELSSIGLLDDRGDNVTLRIVTNALAMFAAAIDASCGIPDSQQRIDRVDVGRRDER